MNYTVEEWTKAHEAKKFAVAPNKDAEFSVFVKLAINAGGVDQSSMEALSRTAHSICECAALCGYLTPLS